MATLGEVVVSLAGDLGGGVGLEGAIGGGRAWRKGFGVEFGGGVVAYEDTGLVLEEWLVYFLQRQEWPE